MKQAPFITTIVALAASLLANAVLIGLRFEDHKTYTARLDSLDEKYVRIVETANTNIRDGNLRVKSLQEDILIARKERLDAREKLNGLRVQHDALLKKSRQEIAASHLKLKHVVSVMQRVFFLLGREHKNGSEETKLAIEKAIAPIREILEDNEQTTGGLATERPCRS